MADQSTGRTLGGIPIRIDSGTPLDRVLRNDDGDPTFDRDGKEIMVPVDYVLLSPPDGPQEICVHPDRWEIFREALDTVERAKADRIKRGDNN